MPASEDQPQRRATDMASMAPPGVWNPGSILHHTERIVSDLEKRITSIFVEHRHQLVTAEQEREKSAERLRAAMERLIEEGDTNLGRHIEAQFKSVEAALTAVERLADEKDKRIEQAHTAAQVAVDKALVAQKELADKHNDLIRSQERKEATYATKEELTNVRTVVHDQSGVFARNDVVTAELKAMQKEIERLRGRDDRSEGRESATTRQQDRVQPWILFMAGAVVSLVLSIIGLGAFT